MPADPKTALVTGANRGIGFQTAKELAARGWTVFLGARSPEKGGKAAASLGVDFIPLDVADPESIRRAAAELAKRTGRLDVLVNNAGIYADGAASILDTAEETLLRTLRTNTIGPLQLIQALWPLLAKSGRGRVINVSSGLGQLADMEGDTPAYSISKTALNAVTRQCASVLAGRNISVNSVCPGWVRTDMGGAGATRSVEEGADTIVWLATEAPAGLTGQFLRDRKPIHW